MNVSVLKIEDIVMSPFNPRAGIAPGDILYEKIRRGIETFGMVEPIIVNTVNNHCVGGNQRLQALRDMGALEIESVLIDEPDVNREKALTIALNKIKGQWDDDKLTELLSDLVQSDADMEISGFEQSELDAIIGNWDSVADDSQTDLEIKPIINTNCVIAGHRFTISANEYIDLLNRIKTRRGFSDQTIIAEFKRRLSTGNIHD